jgi:PKD repeat protein
MKHIFLTTLIALLAGLAGAQTAVTVTGQVTRAFDGQPLENWFVYAWSADPNSFGQAYTDNTGHYTISFTVPASLDEITVITDNGCPNNPALPPFQEVVLPVGSGTLVQDFSVCGEIPPFPDCSVFPWMEPTPDSLTVQFHADLFSIDSAVATSYLWEFGDGTSSTEANPLHTYAAGGEYWVTVTVTTSTGCTATQITVAWVGEQAFPDCRAWIGVQQVDSLTFEFSADLIALDSSQAVSYLWSFGDGTTSTEANPQHVYAQAGFYLVTLTVVTDSDCEAFAELPLDTSFPPFPDCYTYFSYVQSDTTTFAFSADTWSVFGDPASVLSYSWDFGDSTVSNEANPVHTYAQPGIYTVQLQVVTEDSCVAYACDVVLALDCPIDTFWYGCQAMFAMGFDINPDGTVNPPADPLTVTFWDMSLGAVTGWAWDFGDGTTDTVQNPTHVYAAEGIYTVSLAITTVDGCESAVSFEIFVGEQFPWLPEPDCQAMFVPLPDTLGSTGIQFIDVSFSLSPIQSWSWSFGDGTSSNEQNPFHVYAQSGVYPVSLTITADSCNSVITFEVDTENPWRFTDNVASLGVAGAVSATGEAPRFEGVNLFPNPVRQEFQVVFSSREAQDVEVRLTDLSGRQLQATTHRAVAGPNNLRLNAAGLPPGFYLLRLASAGRQETLKFVKE